MMLKMNILNLTYRRVYGMIHKNSINFRWTLFLSKTNLLSLKNKDKFRPILILGLVPVIPTVSAENLSTNDKKSEDGNSNDVIGLFTVNEEAKDYAPVEKTPWERVKAIYEIDEFGNRSKEMLATLQACYLAILVGFMYGGVQSSRVALQDFMERNQATLFENHIDAKKRLSNHVSIHFGKGAFRWAWRLTAFTGGFMLLFFSLHAYRGTTSLIDYTASGAIMGSLMRLKLGPPGIIVGGGLGGILGLLGGMMGNSLLSLTGQTFDDVLSAQYEFEMDRKRIMDQKVKEMYEKNSELPKEAFQMLNEQYSKDKDR